MKRRQKYLLFILLVASLLICIALVSRFLLSDLYSLFSVKRVYQSWFEHLLSGVATPSLIMCSLLLVCYPVRLHVLRIIPRSHIRWLLLIIPAVSYLAASLHWEVNGIDYLGYFQWGEYAMDNLGVMIFCLGMLWVYSNGRLKGVFE